MPSTIDYRSVEFSLPHMEKGDKTMKLYVAASDPSGSSAENTESVGQKKVYDFSETQIVSDGKTITVCFPDEEKPL